MKMKIQHSKNIWDAAKVVLRGKFIAQKCYKLENGGRGGRAKQTQRKKERNKNGKKSMKIEVGRQN